LGGSLKKIHARYFARSTELPEEIGRDELLGRGIFDSRKARQAQRGRVPPGVFRERTGIRELSVDRLSFGHHEQISEIHNAERAGQQFHGWATVLVANAEGNGREVVARPILPSNPYHAEIVLPDMEGLDADEEQEAHALSLAMLSTWLAGP
jgi:hypothetical protein